MSQPVKLSNALVLDARLAGEVMERSIAGQVEYWARLGRSLERLLAGHHAMALYREGAQRTLSECLADVGAESGRARLREHLRSLPFPHFEPHPERKDLLIKIDANGERTIGRFVNRQFRTVGAKSRGKRG